MSPAGRSRTSTLALAGATAAIVAGCGDGQKREERPREAAPAAAHVHGLGVNPKDGALLIATHAGLFRVGRGEERSQRVGRVQDTMGFTVVGPDRFLGSGHPAPGQPGPTELGMISSNDGGRSWRSVSLAGSADFHILRARGRVVYGFEATSTSLLVTRDGGRNWKISQPPGRLFDLVVRPGRARSVVGADESGLVRSSDGGRTWLRLKRTPPAFLAWPQPDRLYRVDPRSRVSMSRNGGRTWRTQGSVEAEPAAFAADGEDLYVALHDGTIKLSVDDGRTWVTRATLNG